MCWPPAKPPQVYPGVGLLRARVDAIPGSVHLRADHVTNVCTLGPQGQLLVCVAGVHIGVPRPLAVLLAGCPLSWCCHILVPNSKASQNSNFKTGFPCCYGVTFVETGGQNILSSTLLT